MILSIEMLCKFLRYEPETGKLFWRRRRREFFEDGKYSAIRKCTAWNGKHAGKEAFTYTNNSGYRQGHVFSKPYLAHRVIWFMETGSWPLADLDHIDGGRENNRLINLREATRSENMRNSGANRGSSSKYCGVSWYKPTKTWIARIMSCGKQTHLGTFPKEEDAARAYDVAAINLHGEFARLNFRRDTPK